MRPPGQAPDSKSGSKPEAIRAIFDAVWTSGADTSGPAQLASLLKDLGISKEKLESTEVKNTLRENTEDAIHRGVFGVPTFEVDGELFWGADSIEFLKDFLANPSVIKNHEMQRLDGLPVAAARKT